MFNYIHVFSREWNNEGPPQRTIINFRFTISEKIEKEYYSQIFDELFNTNWNSTLRHNKRIVDSPRDSYSLRSYERAISPISYVL